MCTPGPGDRPSDRPTDRPTDGVPARGRAAGWLAVGGGGSGRRPAVDVVDVPAVGGCLDAAKQGCGRQCAQHALEADPLAASHAAPTPPTASSIFSSPHLPFLLFPPPSPPPAASIFSCPSHLADFRPSMIISLSDFVTLAMSCLRSLCQPPNSARQPRARSCRLITYHYGCMHAPALLAALPRFLAGRGGACVGASLPLVWAAAALHAARRGWLAGSARIEEIGRPRAATHRLQRPLVSRLLALLPRCSSGAGPCLGTR